MNGSGGSAANAIGLNMPGGGPAGGGGGWPSGVTDPVSVPVPVSVPDGNCGDGVNGSGGRLANAMGENGPGGMACGCGAGGM